MFGPDDPGYSTGTLRAYGAHPERWYEERQRAHDLVGRAMSCVVGGTVADLRRARRAVGDAVRLFVRTGLTRDQAVDQVVSLAQSLGGLE